MSLESTINPLLKLRSESLAKARDFFAKRKIMEVDCGALRRSPPLDANIDVMSVSVTENEVGYLHTSPEYAMKTLLSQGSGDIYFLGHVYRKGELGPRHNPEFTMAEWYRIGYTLADMIEETSDFLTLFTEKLPKRILSYREAFHSLLGLNYSAASTQDLQRKAQQFGIDFPREATSWEKDTWIHLLLTHVIEPELGKNEMTILTDYPPHEAALACVVEKQGEPVAERFEIYINGLELANGYHELANASELRNRFYHLNQQRKEPYALDEQLLSALESRHFPPCCGVSVGFDRALMIQQQSRTISELLPFAWH